MDKVENKVSTQERCRASMVLAGVGDAMGYRSGAWEFCASTSKILKDLNELTNDKGVLALDCSKWMVSDDTVELLATGEGMVIALNKNENNLSLDSLMKSIAIQTEKCGNDFTGRAPGKSE